jgi:hypothetical protein
LQAIEIEPGQIRNFLALAFDDWPVCDFIERQSEQQGVVVRSPTFLAVFRSEVEPELHAEFIANSLEPPLHLHPGNRKILGEKFNPGIYL